MYGAHEPWFYSNDNSPLPPCTRCYKCARHQSISQIICCILNLPNINDSKWLRNSNSSNEEILILAIIILTTPSNHNNLIIPRQIYIAHNSYEHQMQELESGTTIIALITPITVITLLIHLTLLTLITLQTLRVPRALPNSPVILTEDPFYS